MPRRGGDSTERVSRDMEALVQAYLDQLNHRMRERPGEVVSEWGEVVGEYARMTRADRFVGGVLYVVVNNSTLMSLLHGKKGRLLSLLRQRVPGVSITDLVFRFGV